MQAGEAREWFCDVSPVQESRTEQYQLQTVLGLSLLSCPFAGLVLLSCVVSVELVC